MYEYYGTTIVSSIIVLLIAKFALPWFFKLIRLDKQVLHITQGLIIAYAIVFGLVIPLSHLVLSAYHFVTPF